MGQEVGHVKSRLEQSTRGKEQCVQRSKAWSRAHLVLVTTEGQLAWKVDSKGAQGWDPDHAQLFHNYLSSVRA